MPVGVRRAALTSSRACEVGNSRESLGSCDPNIQSCNNNALVATLYKKNEIEHTPHDKRPYNTHIECKASLENIARRPPFGRHSKILQESLIRPTITAGQDTVEAHNAHECKTDYIINTTH